MDINTDIDPCPYTFSLDSSESQSRTMLPVIQLQPGQYFLTTLKKMAFDKFTGYMGRGSNDP